MFYCIIVLFIELKYMCIYMMDRSVTRALIGGGGGVYIHIFVFCPTNFF